MSRILPFIISGIVIVLAVMALLVLSSAIFWGTLLGLVIYAIAQIKRNFFNGRNYNKVMKTTRRTETKQGRIIDLDE
jgi:ABC-type siderophore export system fused ATPase/permease subunit